MFAKAISSLLACLIIAANPACADQFVAWSDYEIHYATFSSLIIPSDVADVHGIVRSKGRIVTNISIRQDGLSVKADIAGTSTNLLEQVMSMDFVEVAEQQAIYYLASQSINEKDMIRFRIRVQPENSDEAYTLEFTRRYY